MDAQEPLGAYPEPQRLFWCNLAAYTWGELWRITPSPLRFLFTAPVVACCKVLRRPFLITTTPIPREVSFAPTTRAVFDERFPKVEPWIREIKDLGFEHFTTFHHPEMAAINAVLFLLVNRVELAYALVQHALPPYGNRSGFAFGSHFADGGSLATTTVREHAALVQPPHRHAQYVRVATPAHVWRAHLSQREEQIGRAHV